MNFLCFINLSIIFCLLGCGSQNLRNMDLDTFRSKLTNKVKGTKLKISFKDEKSSDVYAKFVRFYIQTEENDSYLFLEGIKKCSADKIKSIDVLCGDCGKILSHGKRCVQCKTVYYCDSNCQRRDWKKQHKKDCNRIKNKIEEEKKNTYEKQMSFIKRYVEDPKDLNISPADLKSMNKFWNENGAYRNKKGKYSFPEK